MSAAPQKNNGVIQLKQEEQRVRYSDGWRAGKPEEDPEKLKKWGRVTAQPSEFLIHMRRGVMLTGSSGQGASCFKWPWDAVAVVPTTVQRLRFVADQVTNEKVGVQVTGLAVYRISDPVIAYRMLNFSFPERASEKLEQLLVEMFIGAARRLVANLSVEECLTRRKEGIAEELMREISPVVSGSGRLEDSTDKGWGVVIDTIEIQDVRVLSEKVFGNMQEPYRQEQERRAREAELSREKAVSLQQLASQTEIANKSSAAEEQARLAELAAQLKVAQAKHAQDRALQQQRVQFEAEKIAAETELRTRKQQSEEQARLAELSAMAKLAEAKVQQEQKVQQKKAQADLERLQQEQALELQKQAAVEKARLAELELQTRLQDAQLSHERQMAEARLSAEVERARLEAEAAAARHQAELAMVSQAAEVEQQRANVASARLLTLQHELRIAELEAQRTRIASELDISHRHALKQIENTVSPEAIQLALAEKLPQIAQGFAQKMGSVNVTAIDGANPFGFVAAAVEGVMGLAKSAGLKLPETMNGHSVAKAE